ncbi:hypothetical protein C8F01DRAFT_1188420 [Mycena amicta]|nr:hypothetical protein C8F01DRAFT_1188420 [Mycena amicta]
MFYQRHLWDLPVELLEEVLLYLDLDDLQACLYAGSYILHTVVAASVKIAYKAQLEVAGVEQNPHWAGLTAESTVARLLRLLKREIRWFTFTPTTGFTVELPETAQMYDTIPNGMVIADLPDESFDPSLPTRIQYLCTVPKPDVDVEDTEAWTTVYEDDPFLAFAAIPDENDMLAVVTCCRRGHTTDVAAVNLELRFFSTGALRDDVAQPMIYLQDTLATTDGYNHVCIEVVGSTVAILLNCVKIVYAGGVEYHGLGRALHLYDWRSGRPLIRPLGCAEPKFTFIAPDVLLLAGYPHNNQLYVLAIPQLESDEQPVTIDLDVDAMAFSLPPLQAQRSILAESFGFKGAIRSGENYATNAVVDLQSRFHFRDSEGITLVSYSTARFENVSSDPVFHQYIEEDVFQHMFVLRRKALLDIFRQGQPEPHDGRREAHPWDSWGPTCTRFLDPEVLPIDGLMTTAGQRIVTFARNDSDSDPAPIRILDFNEWTVEKAILRYNADKRPDLWNTIVTSRHAEENMSLSVHPEGQEYKSTVRIVLADDFSAFTVSPLTSALAYVQVTSAELYDFDVVHLNNSSVLGISTVWEENAGRDVTSVQVLHFG